MTGAELLTLIHWKCKTNSTTFVDADVLVLVNLMKNEIASRIQQVRQEVFNIIYLTNVAVSGTTREYDIPAEALNHIVDLEMKFTATGDFVRVIPLARRHYTDVLQESVIVDNFDNLDPQYFVRRKKVYILSGTTIAVTNGFKLVYARLPVDLANLTGSACLSVNSSTENGVPYEFHELWARRVSIEYKDRNDIPFSQKEREYEKDLQKALDDFAIVNLDKEIYSSLPPSVEIGNNGEDY